MIRAIDREAAGYDLVDTRQNAGIYLGRPKATQRAKPKGHKQSIRKAHPALWALAFMGREWSVRRKARWQGSRPEKRIVKAKSAKANRRQAKKAERRLQENSWILLAITSEGQHGDARYLYRRSDGKLQTTENERDEFGKAI